MKSQAEIEAALMTVLMEVDPANSPGVVALIGATLGSLAWVLNRPEGRHFDALLAQTRAEHAERDRRLKR